MNGIEVFNVFSKNMLNASLNINIYFNKFGFEQWQ